MNTVYDGRFRWFLSIGLLVLLGGCGRSDIGQVDGTVTLDGQPLPDVLVEFEPVNGGRSSSGKTDAQGKYVLDYTSSEQGAMVGEHIVRITAAETEVDEEGNRPQRANVPAKYNTESELKKTVQPGKQTIDLAL